MWPALLICLLVLLSVGAAAALAWRILRPRTGAVARLGDAESMKQSTPRTLLADEVKVGVLPTEAASVVLPQAAGCLKDESPTPANVAPLLPILVSPNPVLGTLSPAECLLPADGLCKQAKPCVPEPQSAASSDDACQELSHALPGVGSAEGSGEGREVAVSGDDQDATAPRQSSIVAEGSFGSREGITAQADLESERPSAVIEPRQDDMRITKRSSGGRGEYEISGTFGSLTPWDLVDRSIVLDLGGGLAINTQVVLRDIQGKRRLRMETAAGCEMHLHRQIAAAVMMPRPARDENTWGNNPPVLQSGLYGIGNISLADVQLLSGGRVLLVPGEIEVANSSHQEQLLCPRRTADVRAVWAARNLFPPLVAQLLEEHERFVRLGEAISENLEETVAQVQEVLSAQSQALGIPAAPEADPLSLLLQVKEARRTQPKHIEAVEVHPTSSSATPDMAVGAKSSADAGEAPVLPEPPQQPTAHPTTAAAQLTEEPPIQQAEDVATAVPFVNAVDDAAAHGDASPLPDPVERQKTGLQSPPKEDIPPCGADALGRSPVPPISPEQPAASRPQQAPAATDEPEEDAEDEQPAAPPLPSTTAAPPTHTERVPRRRPEKPAKPKGPPVPHRHQPTQRGGTRPRRTSTDSGNGGQAAGDSRERPAPIELHLRNQRGGTVAVSLLPRRRDGMPAAVNVAGAGSSPFAPGALRDDWYQEVDLPDLGAILSKGAEWYADTEDGGLRWSLAGRDLYVLGTSDEWSGFVSTPCLVLGDQHAVLCTDDLVPQVKDLLRECCGTVPTPLRADDGLPAGWVAFRPVAPTKPLPLGKTPDILDALRPSPDLEIALRGGICLQLRSAQWLAGHPPAIRLYGDAENAGTLAIDGVAAVQGPNGSFTVPGWDAVGNHAVSCAGRIKNYSIVEPAEGWEAWPAYVFPALAARGIEPGICGALVFSSVPDHPPRPPLLVPASNPILLGREPGQIYRCPAQQDICLPFCAAFPPFTPLWAVPAIPSTPTSL